MAGNVAYPDFHFRRAARHARAGGVLCYPTEAVFGLGCAPDQLPAIRRILTLKQRSWAKGLIVIGANPAQLRAFCRLDNNRWQAISAQWPAAKTFVVPKAAGVSPWLSGDSDSIALRVPACAHTRALCRYTGALVSTSANPSQRPPARSQLAARAYFHGQGVYFVPGATAGHLRPSTIVHWQDGHILRS